MHAGPASNYEATLDDGTELVFRRLEPTDRDRLREGFRRLSPESRYRRFFRGMDDLSEKDLDYLTRLDRVNHDAWIGLLRDAEGQPGVGVARWVRLHDEPEVAEGAVTVLDDYQGRGIGKTLLWLAGRGAIEQGIRAIRAVVLADNVDAIGVVKALGARTGPVDGGLVETTFDLPLTADGLDGSPVPLVLRAVAAGQIDARLHGERTTELG